MAAAGAKAPIIIKRKKVVGGGGHHGGAWKVAYADFVTAMMAFFMLMWLLNATTEQQRKGIADYFSPTLPINRVSGGGEGMFGGENILAEDILVHNGTGASPRASGDKMTELGAEPDSDATESQEVATLRAIEDALLGQGGESLIADALLQHVVTRLTDEGLIIEFFDLDGAGLFIGETAEPAAVSLEIATILARVFKTVTNGVAVVGHTRSRPIVQVDNPVWELSTARAMAIRDLLEEDGLAITRFDRVTGQADRKLVVSDPLAVRTNRIEVILLRSDI